MKKDKKVKIKQSVLLRWEKARIDYGSGFYTYLASKSGVPYHTLYSAFCDKPQTATTINKIDSVIHKM